ncbi:hypothetical protein ACFWJS_40245 [Streptomyces sp. NPDC127061]|uniref:hypothetical protein n=1 Tax=Streptomyces sp. NPDC127061 TaxID=3347122 RepID=UPI0036631A89
MDSSAKDALERWLLLADGNHDGKVTREELTKYLQANNMLVEYWMVYFDWIDIDRSGVVDRQELVAAYQQEKDQIEANTVRVNKLTKPYPATAVRITSKRASNSARYYDGIIKKVEHEGGNNYKVTQFNQVNNATQVSSVYGDDLVTTDASTSGAGYAPLEEMHGEIKRSGFNL